MPRRFGSRKVLCATGKNMKNYKLTLIGLAISVVVLLIAIFFEVDLFEQLSYFLQSLEKYEVDEFIIPIAIVVAFTLFDLIRRQRSQKIELEKIKIYQAMMSSTHHILNNFLNKMQLFKMEAEDNPGFNPDILTFYDKIIEDASMKIDALGRVTNINESSIHAAVTPQPNTRACAAQQDASADARTSRR